MPIKMSADQAANRIETLAKSVLDDGNIRGSSGLAASCQFENEYDICYTGGGGAFYECWYHCVVQRKSGFWLYIS